MTEEKEAQQEVLFGLSNLFKVCLLFKNIAILVHALYSCVAGVLLWYVASAQQGFPTPKHNPLYNPKLINAEHQL